MSTPYPLVLSEESTLRGLIPATLPVLKPLPIYLPCLSIARYGDGEFNLIKGGNCVSQKADHALAAELRAILYKGSTPELMVAIPNMTTLSPKTHWQKNKDSYSHFLNPKPSFEYGSSFITRPDSAPWINTAEYWETVESLWKNKNIILVNCGERSLTVDNITSAKLVIDMRCPRIS